MKRGQLISLAALLAGASAWAADNPASTAGSITQHNELSKNRYVIIKTPSILQAAKSPPVEPDVYAAIEHYDQAAAFSTDPDVRAESMRRAADLRVQLADGEGAVNLAEVRKAIDLYNRLLAEQPDYAKNDRVLYQLARADELAGDPDKGIDALRTLGQKYPNSARKGDAVFRAAELLYQRGRYAEAEPEYHSVLALGPGTRFFEPAQYKYGWTLYKQSKYEEAVPVFFAMLDRELPPGQLDDPEPALAAVKKEKLELTRDALRVSGLSFAALGGGKAVNDYFNRTQEPRFATLVYAALGAQLLDKQRYSDAAGAYSAFIERHPGHPLAPAFQTRVIAAFQQGGFDDAVIHAKETYVNTYAPGAPYWASKAPSAEVMTELRKDLDDLGPYYQARAQKLPVTDPERKTAFAAAAGWYRKTIELYPNDPKLAATNLHLADSLYDGGQTREAAQQYEKTAYSYKDNPQAAEAAYAAVQAYQRLAGEVPAAEKPAALRQSVAASVKLADAFPTHPQAALALTRAAEDLYGLKDYEPAIVLANRVLQSPQAAPADLRRQALGVVADARFAQAQYPQAEAAYTELLKLTPADAPERKVAVDQLSAAIYKQGEAARDAGDLRKAAEAFQRVGRLTPDASIRPNADYDAASAFVALQDWPAAEGALEGFRTRYPDNPLASDADKKLAQAYQKDNKPGLAADAYLRISQRGSESLDNRREAAWISTQLYDQAKLPAQSAHAYETYLAAFPQPLDRAMQARRRLADIARDQTRDSAGYLHWLQEIVNADAAAGAARSDSSKRMAAQASLEMGRIDAGNARQLTLSLPLDKSLAQRKVATETAIAALNRAAAYGYAEITTAATYEIGNAYSDFGRALTNSQRPSNLKAEALEQYNLLLEEQATPFDDKAIAAHEANLQRLQQGLWNDSIRNSVTALAELAPAKYGKREQREDHYDSLR